MNKSSIQYKMIVVLLAFPVRIPSIFPV